MTKFRRPKPDYDNAVLRLVRLLKTEPWGATVTFEAISTEVGWDITQRRTAFYTAANRVTGETGRTFKSITNVGYLIQPPRAQPALPLAAAPAPQQMEIPAPVVKTAPEPASPPDPAPVTPLPTSPWAEVEAALRRAVIHTAREALDGMDPER